MGTEWHAGRHKVAAIEVSNFSVPQSRGRMERVSICHGDGMAVAKDEMALLVTLHAVQSVEEDGAGGWNSNNTAPTGT